MICTAELLTSTGKIKVICIEWWGTLASPKTILKAICRKNLDILAGDVIHYRGAHYIVLTNGFKKLTPIEYYKYRSKPTIEKIKEAFNGIK